MTSNILISHPDIFYRSKEIDPYAGDWDDYEELQPVMNLVSGWRHHWSKFTITDQSFGLTANMGTADSVAITATPDHIIIARADKSISGVSPTFYVDSSSNGSGWTNEASGTVNTASLQGNTGKDYLYEISSANTRQYWRAYITATGVEETLSKMYIGTFLDFEVSTETPQVWRDNRSEQFNTITGRRTFIETEEERYHVLLKWPRVATAKIELFRDRIERHLRLNGNPLGVFLYDKPANGIFDGHSLIHCRIVEPPRISPPIEGKYDIEIRFEEMIG